MFSYRVWVLCVWVLLIFSSLGEERLPGYHWRMVLRRGLGNRTNRIRQEIDLLFVLLFAWGGGSYPQRAEKNLVEFQPSCQLLVCAAHAVGGSTAPQDDTSQGWGILLFHMPCFRVFPHANICSPALW